MKKQNILFLAMMFLMLMTLKAIVPLSEKDRDFALNYLKSTQKELVRVTKSLNEVQLKFKPTADSWSIAECLEHIAISEDFIFGLSQNSLENSADEGETAFEDETLINIITDRSQKSKSLEPLKPNNNYVTSKDAISAFNKSRELHIEYLRNTSDPLRENYFDFPFGKGDAYQVILFMAAHSERHIKQIKEIISNPDFPK